MQNFEFLSPTEIIFGKDKEEMVGEKVKEYSDNCLLVYGGGSIKKYGVYDKVTASLKEAGVNFIEHGGVKPNPRLSKVHEGIEKAREHDLDFILAVGGGSVIDSAKATALGVEYEGEVWDFFAGKKEPQSSLPVGVILTIPAAGSEASKSAVITNEDGWLKRGLNTFENRPVFAIENPEITYTLPDYQTSCGTVDIMAHIMERYFTNVSNVDITDRLCESGLKTMIKNTPKALENPKDYAARAEIMWTSTLAHNDIMGTGREGDWSSHAIEHELSALYDIAHGAGLAIVFPAWMKYVYKHDIDRFVQFAVRVFNVDQDFENPERTAREGIRRLEKFFERINMPTRLKDIDISDDDFEKMAGKIDTPLGNFVELNKEDIINIYELALE